MIFVHLIQKIWFDIKVYLRLHFFYKQLLKQNISLKSLLSKRLVDLLQQGTKIEQDVQIDEQLQSIGPYVFIGKSTKISNCKSIGAFSSISHNVDVGLGAHPLNYVSTSPAFYRKRRGLVNQNKFDESNQKSVEIGADVLISASAQILNGVTLHTGCVVGAGSFVNKDVPPYAIVAGSPAKVISYRFDQSTIKALLASKWFEKDLDWLSSKANLMQDADAFLKELS